MFSHKHAIKIKYLKPRVLERLLYRYYHVRQSPLLDIAFFLHLEHPNGISWFGDMN